MGHLSRVMAEKLLKSVTLRLIFSENIRDAKINLPLGKNVERKLFPEVSVIMIISEKEASISFPRIDGNVDYPSFFGSDALFLKWINDYSYTIGNMPKSDILPPSNYFFFKFFGAFVLSHDMPVEKHNP